jgi:hypothetical protein
MGYNDAYGKEIEPEKQTADPGPIGPGSRHPKRERNGAQTREKSPRASAPIEKYVFFPSRFRRRTIDPELFF